MVIEGGARSYNRHFVNPSVQEGVIITVPLGRLAPDLLSNCGHHDHDKQKSGIF